MLQICAGGAAQDIRGGCGAEPERGRVLDHLVVLPADQLPVDRPRQHRLQGRVGVGFAHGRTIEPLRVNALEPRQQLKAKQAAEGKGNIALAMAVDIGFLDCHFGAVPQHPLDHGGDLGGGGGLQLRIDAGAAPLDVPVDHDAAAAVADVPLGHQVLVPGTELLRVGGTSRRALAPDADHSYGLIAECCPNQAIVCLLRPAPKQEQGFARRRTGRVQLGQRAALYCRVSTADQSCARQERDLTAFADRAGYEVVGVFKEIRSGVRLDRAERRKVMALAQARQIDAVLVTELSRWGRSTTDLLATLKELEARRVSVVALNGMTFDLATPHGRMLATMLAGIAECKRELIQERIRSGIAAAKARGKRLGRQPGQRPKSDRLAPQVLALVAEGRSYCLIGRELGLSKNTVAEIVKRRRATAAQTI